MSAVETCPEFVSDGNTRWPRYHRCGRAVKEDGLCGIHLAAKRRVRANEKKRQDAQSDSAKIRTRVEAFLAEHGVAGKAEYDARTYPLRYTGRVSLSLDELKRILGVTS